MPIARDSNGWGRIGIICVELWDSEAIRGWNNPVVRPHIEDDEFIRGVLARVVGKGIVRGEVE